ncbi:MAG: NADH-quinone oxidoreductase subunit NuoF, partial [Actinomycetota bacterium]
MVRRKGRAVTGTYAHAAGFYAGDRPRIVTSRFEHADSYSLERYLATGGYQGLRKALARPSMEVHDEVKKATVLGRGGAGFPAGTKWGLTPEGVFPRYLVVN